ncbi:hypothetical protein HY386_01405 [Candidatus Daviesbacteria bacterium]|nr:hypothetical protein [Candidatus Daviesbacteria bacterium]
MEHILSAAEIRDMYKRPDNFKPLSPEELWQRPSPEGSDRFRVILNTPTHYLSAIAIDRNNYRLMYDQNLRAIIIDFENEKVLVIFVNPNNEINHICSRHEFPNIRILITEVES